MFARTFNDIILLKILFVPTTMSIVFSVFLIFLFEQQPGFHPYLEGVEFEVPCQRQWVQLCWNSVGLQFVTAFNLGSLRGDHSQLVRQATKYSENIASEVSTPWVFGKTHVQRHIPNRNACHEPFHQFQLIQRHQFHFPSVCFSARDHAHPLGFNTVAGCGVIDVEHYFEHYCQKLCIAFVAWPEIHGNFSAAPIPKRKYLVVTLFEIIPFLFIPHQV
mmetsp:Transcript_4862/g.10093  ORF Transcript_4862/g.10093 Transcript_4862/m.10093 type:complete len:218 (+) Transcript_4862:656-1309(+)